MKKRTKFAILSVTALILYAVAVLVLNAFDKTVQPELTISWFSAWTSELAMLFGIKIKDKGDKTSET